jgi:hypothetical protein
MSLRLAQIHGLEAHEAVGAISSELRIDRSAGRSEPTSVMAALTTFRGTSWHRWHRARTAPELASASVLVVWHDACIAPAAPSPEVLMRFVAKMSRSVAAATGISAAAVSSCAGAAGDAGGASPACAFADTQVSDNVTVRLTNAGPNAVYVGPEHQTCFEAAYFSVADQNGTPWQSPYGSCYVTCAELARTDVVCSMLTICRVTRVVRIDPGGFHEFTWQGTLAQPVNMPAACYVNPALVSDTCRQLIPAPSGQYRFSASAWSGWAVGDIVPPTGCNPTGTGSCPMDGSAVVSGDPTSASGILDYPGSKLVELKFE